MSEANQFERLASIDVSKHVEKKANLSYLSWAWAVDQLLRQDPAANWAYPEPRTLPDGTQMVICDVTAFGKTMRSYLPVMDYKNKPIPNPDAFATNTAMQRCLVKAIALHGLGLYIYAGEDLPYSDAPSEKEKAATVATAIVEAFQGEEETRMLEEWQGATAIGQDFAMLVWGRLGSKERRKLKDMAAAAREPITAAV